MNRADIYDGLVKLSMDFHFKPKQETLQRCAERIAFLPLGKIAAGMKYLLSNNFLLEHGEYFPSNAQILKAFDDSLSPADEANEGAGRIIEAIRRLGYMNQYGAKNQLGEALWKAVEGCGGWTALCSTMDRDLGMIKAQLRDLVRAVNAREAQKLKFELISGENLKGIEE